MSLIALLPLVAAADTYSTQVLADKPVAYWRFDEAQSRQVNSAVGTLKGELKGQRPLGPRPLFYPDFAKDNHSLRLTADDGFVRVTDPGKKSALDFTKGDSITLEAWVSPGGLLNGRMMYIIGKGRTGQKGFAANNQNYALRLVGVEGGTGLSFLFRDANNSGETSWHRWTSSGVLSKRGDWHHVAVCYSFGKGESIRGYIDGQPVTGTWDMGGQTDLAPLVDDDDVRIGASAEGPSGIPFVGQLDEIAIYRQALSAERMATRFKSIQREFIFDSEKVPTDKVAITIHENVGHDWNYAATEAQATFHQSAFGVPFVPHKYNSKALIVERSDSFLLRAASKINVPKGKHRILLRARTLSRLYSDGEIIAQIQFSSGNTSAHGKVSTAPKDHGGLTRFLRPGMQETVVDFESAGKQHLFLLEAFVGGKGKRPETGGLSVSISINGAPFKLLSPTQNIALTDDNWADYTEDSLEAMRVFNQTSRRSTGITEMEKWKIRHQLARELAPHKLPVLVPKRTPNFPANNAIDHFINSRLKSAGRRPTAMTDDWAFLRRASLDANGVVPLPQIIEQFQRDQNEGRRARAIDRLLKNSRAWADHWTGYWQDVLAENPNILKPKLNNTGPFRFWIHESLQDNKPMDRFLTELVMMEGSSYYGAPAGFGVATQNDVPMAAKAQVLGQAFLGMQMKCARCHDAPFHDFNQKDLFSIAAMLQRAPLAVPKTSSVLMVEGVRKPRVEVTLKPGTKVAAAWPFKGTELSEPIHTDTRAQLAAYITGNHGERFAKVIVNRVWQRYLGWGFVEPADDWEKAKPSHPLLLNWLSREFVTSGYDLQHLARLIMNSNVYQRQIDVGFAQAGKPATRLFAGPARRRLTAEQLIDSLYAVAGKRMGTEMLTLDVNGRGAINVFLNLGHPRRAWEFTSLSNERDRPSLALPKAQSVVDILSTFGWRDARQDALTVRDHEPNALQPAIMANGIVGRRITQLSDDSAFTELALQSIDTHEMLKQVFLRILSRPPTSVERAMMHDHICQTFASRKVKGAKPRAGREQVLDVSWNNHLSSDSNRIKVELERLALEGDPPTQRLRPEWRKQMEDVIYGLVNSPEFIFIP
ncbi:MAG: DUF1553 domain-containing protein [Verrucomicrobiota bacterium]|nr:DUF1553 domain-containing protein [Verrucomicrobiota bacterium]